MRPALARGPDALAYTVPEAARLLRIGRSTLYELIGADAVKTIKVGDRRLVRRADLESFLDRLEAEREAEHRWRR